MPEPELPSRTGAGVRTSTTGLSIGSLSVAGRWKCLGLRDNANCAGYRIAPAASGDVVDTIDSDGNATQSFYDGEGRLIQESKVQGGVTISRTWGYNDFTTTFKDWDGSVTVTKSDPTTDTTVETWYADISQQTALRRITSISDAAGDLISVTDVANPDSGSPVTMSTWSATYDDLGRMTNSSESFHIGPISGGSNSPTQNFVYTYTANSLLQSSTLTPGSSTTPTETTAYAYDGENRVASVTQTANTHVLQAQFGYLPDDRISSITRLTGATANSLGNVTTAQFAYQTDGQLHSLTHVDSAGTTTLSSFVFGYDANHRVISKAYTGPTLSETRTYGYDADGQLMSVTVNGVPATSYQYDANGNSAAAGTTIGSNNELVDDGTFTYAYDNAGRMITRTADAGGTGSPAFTAYQYDNRGRLVTVTEKTAAGALINQVIYNYDAFNRLVGETVTSYDSGGNPTTTSKGFVYDGENIVAEIDSLGNVTRTNLWGPGANQLLASDIILSESTTTIWPLFDEEGTVRDLYLLNGGSYQIGQSQTFDEFGKLTNTTAASPNMAFGAFGTYYAGHQLDPLGNLYYAGARWYDPSTHQFITPDPAGFAAGDPNLYRYAGNDATDLIDPSGLEDIPIIDSPLSNPRQYAPGRVFQHGRVSDDGSNFMLNKAARTASGELTKEVPIENGYPKLDKFSKGDVEIAVTGDDSFDQGQARAAYKAKYGKLPPEDYTFHHNGARSKLVVEKGKTYVVSEMQAVPSKSVNRAVPHNGSSSQARRYVKTTATQSGRPAAEVLEEVKTEAREFNEARIEEYRAGSFGKSVTARGLAILGIYSTIKDALTAAGVGGLGYEEIGEVTYYFRDETNSVFVVQVPGLLNFWGSSSIKYVAGPKEGTTETISKEQVSALREAAEKVWGKYIPGGLFSEPRFIPGTQRDKLPLFKTGPFGGFETDGWIDDNGIHRYAPNDLMRTMT